MFLYLLRHADAMPTARSDAARVLTENGVLQAQQVGQFCRKHKLLPEIILTSPYHRAEQTARLFATEINQPKLVEVAPFLGCGMDPETALNKLMGYKELESAMLVGHEPDLGELASLLLGSSYPGKIRIKKASLTVFELDITHPDSAVLQFSLPVRLI